MTTATIPSSTFDLYNIYTRTAQQLGSLERAIDARDRLCLLSPTRKVEASFYLGVLRASVCDLFVTGCIDLTRFESLHRQICDDRDRLIAAP